MLELKNRKKDGEKWGEMLKERRGSFDLMALIFRVNLNVMVFFEWIKGWGMKLGAREA